jgi:hypothetical protein
MPDLLSPIREYLKRADSTGLKWPLLDGLDEDILYRLFFPDRPAMRVLTEWGQDHQVVAEESFP